MKAKHCAAALVVLVALAGALEARAQCRQFVHYDRKSFSVTLPKFQTVALGSVDVKPQQVQAAAQLTQILDLMQYNDCVRLETLKPGSEAYIKASLAELEENHRLMEMAVLLKGQGSADSLGKSTASTLKQTLELRDLSENPALKDSPAISRDLAEVASLLPEMQTELTNLSRPATPGERLWRLYSDEDKRAIHAKLSQAIDLLTGSLNLRREDLGAFLLIPGGDGYLYFPPGMIVKPRQPDLQTIAMRIPVSYGAAGVAFEENSEEFVRIDNQFTFGTGVGADAENARRQARMVLLPPPYDKQIEARAIVALPIRNPEGKAIAVMTISVYRFPHGPEDLSDAYEAQKGAFLQLTGEIASHLMLGKAAAAPVAKP